MITELLISVGIMCAITTVLAIVMVIAEATIANYGEVNININDDKNITVEGGSTLLTTLKDEEVFIPSACGGRGSCGLCKVKVLDGAGEILPTEAPWLTPEEQKEGIRLACQVKVKNDLRISVPEELFNVKQFAAKVTKITDLTHDIKEVCFTVNNPEEINFKAGQFVQLEVPEYELTAEAVYRAYSIASDPEIKDSVELEIRYVPNGICTTYVHRHLKEGDEVTFNGPYGDFFLRETDSPIICIAGGSGMAPIKSILHYMKNAASTREAKYFFGARSKKDLFLLDEMKEFEEQLADFEFIPALSQPEESDEWTGDTGLITEVVARHISDASKSEAYLCGSPFMIDACVKTLTDLGMPEDKIYYDKFA